MKILCIDTSQLQASVTWIENGVLKSSARGSTSVAHSESLLPLVDSTLQSAKAILSDLDLLAVGVGPGSFTGLRIGVATQKAFAQTLHKPILPFSSLQALYFSAFATPQENALAVNPAYQGEHFIGYWKQEHGQWKWQQTLAAFEPWIQKFCADSSQDLKSLKLVGQAHGFSTAESFVTPEGLLATVQYHLEECKAEPQSYLQIQIDYLRASQAEIKWNTQVAK